ncbi:TonB-dependent receptor [Rudaea cellulosilytica]|uniref:TonB-dependent receptor n=1 Tax=Rudaea cellulosilytica TaxID=540746 RepID=UPI000A076DAA|nr:TonB-dependent receptor [Rudaea cellulosilytica]
MNGVSLSAVLRSALLILLGVVSNSLARASGQSDANAPVQEANKDAQDAEKKTQDSKRKEASSEIADTLGTVTVTGYAKSLERALANKREADVVSDGISAEDVGKYPEQNIAESLQRVTGVQITRSLGDGQFLSVRGLDPKFTDTLFNGRQLPTASGTRAFDFQVLTSNFANQVDVYKSPTPDLPESGLAATVNVQSIKPLDLGAERAALNVEGVYDEQAKQGVKPHVSALYLNTFLDNRLGWMVSVDYNQRRLNDQQFTSDGVLPDSTYTGPGTVYRVFGVHLNDLLGTDRRLSGMSMLQFKVNDNLELHLDTIASRFEQRYNYYQGQNFYPGAGALGASPTDSQTLDRNNVETVWSGSNVFAWMQANMFDFLQETTSTALGGTLTFGDWKIDNELSYGEATEHTTQAYVSWATKAPGANLRYDTTKDPGGPISVGFYNGFNPNDPSNYYFFGVQGAYKEPTRDQIWNYRIDATRSLDSGWLKSVKVGANFEDRTLSSTPNWMGNSGAGYPTDMSPYLILHDNSSFFSSYDGGAQVPSSFMTVNLPKFFSDFPLSQIVAKNPPMQVVTATTVVEEKSEAAYVRVDVGDADGRWKANAGLRAVRTEELSSGYSPTSGAYLIYGLVGGSNSLSYTDASIHAQSHTYNNLLPSLNASYLISDDLIARFAAAKVMQRPDMNLLAAASNPNASTSPPPGGTWVGTLAEGNPDLKPYLANQFDVSLEWYFSKRGIFAADFFLKNVQNLVLTNYTKETVDVAIGSANGPKQPIELSVSQPVNATTTQIKGVELGYQQAFDFLPGFWSGLGAQANFTHIWYGSVVLNQGQPALPLPGISKNTYNLGVYYDNGKFDIHAGYNYRSGWVADPLSYFGDGIFVKGYGQLDLSANYKVNSKLSFNASVVNLTQSALRQDDRYGITRLYDLSGRRYYVGARLNF